MDIWILIVMVLTATIEAISSSCWIHAHFDDKFNIVDILTDMDDYRPKLAACVFTSLYVIFLMFFILKSKWKELFLKSSLVINLILFFVWVGCLIAFCMGEFIKRSRSNLQLWAKSQSSWPFTMVSWTDYFRTFLNFKLFN